MRRGVVLWVLFGVLASCEASAPSRPIEPASAEPGASYPIFVSVEQFEGLRQAGATVLDARADTDYASGHIPGAASVPWQAFVDGERTGLLSADVGRLERQLREAGVDNDRPVLVYGAWDEAWGEEGRALWMLEYLGHGDVHILDGGVQAWEGRGGPMTGEAAVARRGAFVARVRPEVRATADDIQAALGKGELVVLDIREAEEYQGATPYGEARGGHIPKAVHFRWKDAFTLTGALKPARELRLRFEALGIGEETVVVAYCTGGIRSGFVYALMRALGYAHPKNYDGSWWEWAARAELPVEQ